MTHSNSRTPFLDVQSFELTEEVPIVERKPLPSRSPFLSVYELESGEADYSDPSREAYATIVDDLYDEEFDEALSELVAEARGIHDEHLASGSSPVESERLLSQHFAQLCRESEEMISHLAQQTSRTEQTGLDESEVDSFTESYTPSVSLEPAFEQFFRKLGKKIGRAVKKVGSAALKGVKNLALGPILNRIKALIRPLLNNVLQKAIGKLPQSIQPMARQLASKLGVAIPGAPADTGGADAAAASDPGSPVQDAAGQDASAIQQEFDAQLAQAFLAEDEVELELEVARVRAASAMPASPVFSELDAARERFAEQLQSLQQGEDPQPHIQNFLPAVLPALKVGIRLIGRPRVVNFLSGLLGKLIGRLVGPQATPALSKAIVDAGLKFLNLEMSEEEQSGLAASAVAATVEETLTRVASLPDYVLDNDELLEGFALEAFEHAAAANLPAVFSSSVYKRRPDLLEGGVNAGWVLMPLRGPKRYKKCSRVFNVKVTPQMADEIESFEDETLADYLQDQLGLPEGEEVEAEAYLYEALPGTTASDIVRGESGSLASDLVDAAQLQLLTREAAGALLGRPGLGRNPSPGTSPSALPAGSRLYHIAVPGRHLPFSPLRRRGGQRGRRMLHLNVVLDSVRQQLRVSIFLSEVKAQKLSARLRQNAHMGSLATTLQKLTSKRISVRLRGLRPRGLRIVHPRIAPGPTRQAALERLPAAIPPNFISKVQEWVVTGLTDFFRTHSAKYVEAADQPADGVTLVIAVEQPAGLTEIGQALAGNGLAIDRISEAVAKGGAPKVTVDVFAGHKCE